MDLKVWVHWLDSFFLKDYIIQLVGGLEHDFYDFPYIENVIIPTDFHYIFFSEG